ncbi:MAG TPA: CBS domain-containing protein [Bacillota bacterium]
MTINMTKVFKKGSVGRLMKSDFCSVQDHITVDEAIMMIQEYGKQKSNIHYLYTTNKRDELSGVLSLKKLLAADDDVLLRDIINEDVVFVSGHIQLKEVAQLFYKNDFFIIPVTTKHKHMIGVVKSDDVRNASVRKKRWRFFKK